VGTAGAIQNVPRSQIESTPSPSEAKPSSTWNGLPASQPMKPAMVSGTRMCGSAVAIAPKPHWPHRKNSRNTSTTRARVWDRSPGPVQVQQRARDRADEDEDEDHAEPLLSRRSL
jgi:hypothetical protein